MAANRLAAIIEQEDVLSLEVDIISQITERFSALRDAEKKVAKLIKSVKQPSPALPKQWAAKTFVI